jgi:hypothetical protein
MTELDAEDMLTHGARWGLEQAAAPRWGKVSQPLIQS